jgi:hypothetical protein
LLSRLAATGATLIFEAPTPIFRSPLYRCMEWFNRDNPVCAGGFQTSRAEMARLRAKPLRTMSRLSAEVGGIGIWDPMPILCPEDTCGAILGGRILFIDTDHLYGSAATCSIPAGATSSSRRGMDGHQPETSCNLDAFMTEPG